MNWGRRAGFDPPVYPMVRLFVLFSIRSESKYQKNIQKKENKS
jgi:hypothetical protein